MTHKIINFNIYNIFLEDRWDDINEKGKNNKYILELS